MNLTLGIDPGKTGALAFLDGDGNLAHLEDMPDLTGAALGAWLRSLLDDLSKVKVEAERTVTQPTKIAGWFFAGWASC